MAVEYFQGEYGIDFISEQRNIDKKYFKKFTTQEIREMFVEVKDNKLSNIVVIKLIVNCETFTQFILKFDSKVVTHKQCDKCDFKIGSTTIRFYKSGGRLKSVVDYKGDRANSTAPKTQQQEDGVVFVLKQKTYPHKEEINKSLGFNFSKDWLDSFEKSHKAITHKVPNIHTYDVYRDSDSKKPKFLNEMTHNSILPDSKDNWNPADIWLVKKSYSGADIQKIVDGIKKGSCTIFDLNAKLKELFEKQTLIGVSLKQVTNSSASIKKVEVDIASIKKIKFKKISKKTKMSVLNSYFDINYIIDNNGTDVNYLVRFRPRGKSGSLSTYFEGKPVERSNWDGAFSKDVIKNKYLKSDDEKLRKILETQKIAGLTVLDTIRGVIGDGDFLNWAQKGCINDFIDIYDLEKVENNSFFIYRGIMNLYYIYKLTTKEIKYSDFLLDAYISSNKLNDFSSIHYKVF